MVGLEDRVHRIRGIAWAKRIEAEGQAWAIYQDVQRSAWCRYRTAVESAILEE